MNTAWNRWCRNLPSGTALLLYDNRITPIIISDITGRCNVRIQNPYTCTIPPNEKCGLGMTLRFEGGTRRFSNLDAVFTEIRIPPCYQA